MRNSRKKASVNAKRWAAYAAAGAAAALGGQNSSEADIIVNEPNVPLRDSTPNDGYADIAYAATFGSPSARLIFQAGYSSDSSFNRGLLAVSGSVSGPGVQMSIVGLASGLYNYASNLAYGQNISTLSFLAAGNRGDMAWINGYNGSQFKDTGGYIAFRFDIGNGTRFGWAEVSLDAGIPLNLYTLERIAYAGPGETLYVGQTNAIPEPGSLGLLATGAAGLLAWRRRRKSNA